jgi:hypothetical protein
MMVGGEKLKRKGASVIEVFESINVEIGFSSGNFVSQTCDESFPRSESDSFSLFFNQVHDRMLAGPEGFGPSERA